ncbi:MAG: hypothetical protein O4753_09840 [Trichodesmium sp. St7_bin2_1]|nr:hypothetical protein [Trichodesmium sp. St7_bin2_1]
MHAISPSYCGFKDGKLDLSIRTVGMLYIMGLNIVAYRKVVLSLLKMQQKIY